MSDGPVGHQGCWWRHPLGSPPSRTSPSPPPHTREVAPNCRPRRDHQYAARAERCSESNGCGGRSGRDAGEDDDCAKTLAAPVTVTRSMTRHCTVQYLGACLFPTMPMPFCRGRTNVCVTRQHVRRAILSPSVGRVVCFFTLRSLCCRMPCRELHCRHADGDIRSSSVPCATTGAHAVSSQQCDIYHCGHERTVPHRFSSCVKRSGVWWQGNLAEVLSPPRERTKKCTETSPRVQRLPVCTLSICVERVA